MSTTRMTVAVRPNGITQQTLTTWRGYPCKATDVAHLTEVEAREIYYSQYWITPGFHHLTFLSPVVVEMIFDAAVHHGPSRAAKLLQKAVGVRDDGRIGPVTEQAARQLPPVQMAANYMAERNVFLGWLITKDPTQAVFDHGWEKRISEFIRMIPLA